MGIAAVVETAKENTRMIYRKRGHAKGPRARRGVEYYVNAEMAAAFAAACEEDGEVSASRVIENFQKQYLEERRQRIAR